MSRAASTRSSVATAASTPSTRRLTSQPEAAADERQEPGARLRRGRQVRHASLGRGRVLRIEGSGEDMRLTVYFDKVGRKKLIARFAQLEIM